MDYGINIWGLNNFFIDNSKVAVNYGNEPTLLEIVKEIEKKGMRDLFY
mgnify:CR=1 FL=1